jgi:hypothetical protein
MYPTAKLNPNITQGPKNSQEFNKLCKDIKYDICTLFQETNSLNSEVAYNMDTLALENFFLQAKIADLETRLSAINNSSELKTKIISFKNRENINTDHGLFPKAYINSTDGVVMTPHKVISKNLILNQDNVFVTPADLEFSIFESLDNTSLSDAITDDKKMKAFDGDNTSIWWHCSSFDATSTVEKLYIVLKIKIPLQYLNNALINALTLRAFPDNCMNITVAQYTSPNSTVLKDLENFTTITNVDNVILHFPPEEIETLYLVLEQPYYFISDNKKYFFYGMKDIMISYLDFSTEYSYLVTEFEIKGNFKSINTPMVSIKPGCPTDVNGLLNHKLFFRLGDINTTSSAYNFNENIGPDFKKAYILTQINLGAGYSPVLDSISINYSVK